MGAAPSACRRLRWPLALALAALTFAGSARPAPSAECAPEDAIAATVKSVGEGTGFILADGREVRLAAMQVPPALGTEATSALAALAGTRDVLLRPLDPGTDRYGRLTMHAFIAQPDGAALIEAALVAQGLALASLRGDAACVAALKAAERDARAKGLGFWSPARIMTADDPARIREGRGGFAVVTGKVLSVRESGGTIYLNFGRRWTEDFTATIAKRNERRFTAAGVPPGKLQGRLLRIRGVIEERGGPWIDVTTPEQVELAVDGPPEPAKSRRAPALGPKPGEMHRSE